MKQIFTLVLLLISYHFTFSQDLVYEPINPAFGGDTFNYQWLLSSAQAQDDTEPSTESTTGLRNQSDLDVLTESLNQQFISQISRDFFTAQFGENSLQPGTFVVGSLSVDIVTTTNGLAITILDTTTGESTTVVLPFF